MAEKFIYYTIFHTCTYLYRFSRHREFLPYLIDTGFVNRVTPIIWINSVDHRINPIQMSSLVSKDLAIFHCSYSLLYVENRSGKPIKILDRSANNPRTDSFLNWVRPRGLDRLTSQYDFDFRLSKYLMGIECRVKSEKRVHPYTRRSNFVFIFERTLDPYAIPYLVKG